MLHRLILSERIKDSIISFIVIQIGIYGALIDMFNGTTDLIPDFFNLKQYIIPPVKPMHVLLAEKSSGAWSMSVVWFIFICFGTVIFLAKVNNTKVPNIKEIIKKGFKKKEIEYSICIECNKKYVKDDRILNYCDNCYDRYIRILLTP